jgi:hypothetical protein
MSLALRNKQLLAPIILAVIAVALITFFVIGMALHLNLLHFFFHQLPLLNVAVAPT